MASFKPLEKYIDGNIGKIFRKKGISQMKTNLYLKDKRRRNSLCNDVQKCIIEVTPGTDEIEETVIEIKKDPNNFFFQETYTSKDHDLCITLVNQTIDERVPTTQTISISEDCPLGFINGKDKRKTISTLTRSNTYPTNESGEKRPLQEKISSLKCSLKDWSNYDVKLNCRKLTEEEQKCIKSEVDPQYLLWVEKLKIPAKCQYPQHFMADDFEEVKEVLSKYEHETFTRLLVSDVNCGFRLKKPQYSGETVHFREKGKQELLFHGIPYAICGRLTFRCHQGIFPKRMDKELQRDEKFGPNRKRYRKFKSSKKKNCPFRITVNKILLFPEYRVDLTKDSRNKLYQVSRFIKRNKEKMKFLVKYVFTLPSVFHHRNHQLGDESVSREAVDKRVFDKVEDYVRAGITKAPQVMELLKTFIQHDLEVDPSQWERRKYKPSLKDIRAKIYRTLRDMKSKVEQPVDSRDCRRKALLKNDVIETASSSSPVQIKPDVSNCPALQQHFTTPALHANEHGIKNDVCEPLLQSHFAVDLSEGNVHHEELIAIASIIDVHNDDNGDLDERYHDDDDDKRIKKIGQDISKLNLLSMILRQQDLAELGNDVSNVVNKWKGVLDDVCETTNSNGRKDRARSVKKPRR